MTIWKTLLRLGIALCAIAIQPLWGCAGAEPTRTGERADPVPKIVFAAGGSASAVRASEFFATLVEARITKENARISGEYLPEATVADEQAAGKLGRARNANIVVWSKDTGDGSAELEITVVQPEDGSGSTRTATLSLPWEGGTRKEL